MAMLLAASTPLLLPLLAPFIIGRFGRLLGFILKKKTDGRRAHLISLMNEDDEKYSKEYASSKTSSSGDGNAIGGETKLDSPRDKDWDGIVGFFHPFW